MDLFTYLQDTFGVLATESELNEIKFLVLGEERYIAESNGANPNVSGSLPIDLLRKAYHAGMVEALKRKCAEDDNYEYKQISFDMWLNSVTEVSGNDR